MELNPTTEPIEEPYTDKVKKMLERKGVSYKKEDELIEELANEYNGKAVVGKLDVDNNQESSIKFGVRSIPTLLVFKNGELVDRHVGAVPKDTLSKSLDSNL